MNLVRKLTSNQAHLIYDLYKLDGKEAKIGIKQLFPLKCRWAKNHRKEALSVASLKNLAMHFGYFDSFLEQQNRLKSEKPDLYQEIKKGMDIANPIRVEF